MYRPLSETGYRNMKRIFWIGNPFFQSSLPQCGWEVHFHSFTGERVFGWEDIVHLSPFIPDVVVVADKSITPFILGMENFPCLTVFYAVDTHIHPWFRLYGQAFDACLVSLKDHVELFQNMRLPPAHILWSPPFAQNTDIPMPHIAPEWDGLFVGHITQTTQGRLKFFTELKELVPTVHTVSGNYKDLFPKGRVLLNHCIDNDLNFRVFEALACGGCLLTPKVSHGLLSLFVDGEDFITYEANNAKDAAYKLQILLKDKEMRLRLAQKGFETVDTKHRALHRAQAFTNFMHNNFTKEGSAFIARRQAQAKDIRELCLRALYLSLAGKPLNTSLRAAYLAAAKGMFQMG